MTDDELLESYVGDGNETAFAELVDRYLPLVYGLASREIYDFRLAEEIAQNVFGALARQTRKRRKPDHVSAWIYCTTRKQIALTMRSERRRKRREEAAALESRLEPDHSEGMWNEYIPDLNAALADMALSDQRILFLRFYQGLTLPELGRSLRIKERAAQKRVQRAVERLRKLLWKRGVTLASGMLGSGIFTVGGAVPPPGLSRQLKGLASPASSPGWLAGSGKIIVTSASAVIAISIPTFLTIAVKKSTNETEIVGSGAGTSVNSERSGPEAIAVDHIEAIYQLSGSDREKMLDRLLGHLVEPQAEPYLRDLFSRWSKLDYRRLAMALVELHDRMADRPEDAKQIGLLMPIAFQPWMENDATEACAWVKSLPRSTYAEAYAFEAILDESELDDAWFLLAQRPFNRDRVFEIIFDKAVGALGLHGALGWMGALSPDPSHTDLRTEVQSFSVSQSADRSRRKLWMHAVGQSFAHDRQAVADWVVGLPTSDAARGALEAFAGAWTSEDPGSAADWSFGLTEPARVPALHAVAREWAQREPLPCLAWTLDIEEESLRWSATEQAFQVWLKEPAVHPDAAAWLVPLSDLDRAAPLFRDLTQSLDPAAAASWSIALPVGNNRDLAMDHSFYRLGQTDSVTAVGLFSGLDEADKLHVVELMSLGWLVAGGRRELHRWQASLPAASALFYLSKSAEVDLVAAFDPERAERLVASFPMRRLRDPLVVKLIQRSRWRSAFDSGWITEIVDEDTRLSMQRLVQGAANDEVVTLPEIGRVDFGKQTLEQLRMRLDYVSRQRSSAP